MDNLYTTRRDKWFTAFINFLLTVALVVTLYPIIYIVSSSFSSPTAVTTGQVWLWPVLPSLAGYEAVFQYKGIWTGFYNTAIYTVFGTLISVALTVLAAYPLSRPDFKAKNPLMFLFTFTMFFSGGLIPTYMLVNQLSLYNTRWAVILPSALAVYNLIITRTFFQAGIPRELLEAAKLDGCDDFTFVRKIVLPISGAIIAVNTLFYAIGYWNNIQSALIFLKDNDKMPLQMILRAILIQNQIDPSMMAGFDTKAMAERANLREQLKYSLIVVSSLPVVLLYPFVQKYFVRGIMIGSIKG
ncbi:carbohydrate ABC transporter permease [Cohnella silvisoli]|uniref:Carbohydrate ABC transporter permease n=1 Tax=Cohnella silvisoli TaxID=2873699 RepID=A0ABV1KW82_9BACL|nr:carbohydrate ABC transporter permease [Cohnella silvisoli]MCD9023767.1 carbohydrate ABC transporter permease [Cohnella silvisoli]